jgi:hypothetical protein
MYVASETPAFGFDPMIIISPFGVSDAVEWYIRSIVDEGKFEVNLVPCSARGS